MKLFNVIRITFLYDNYQHGNYFVIDKYVFFDKE